MLFKIERPEQVIAAISKNESRELYEQAAANTPGFRVTFHKDVDPIQPRLRLWKKQRDMARSQSNLVNLHSTFHHFGNSIVY